MTFYTWFIFIFTIEIEVKKSKTGERLFLHFYKRTFYFIKRTIIRDLFYKDIGLNFFADVGEKNLFDRREPITKS